VARTQYQSAIRPSVPTLQVVSGYLTSEITPTWYFWLYSRTRAGVTEYSPSANITVSVGQGINVTIPAEVRAPASDVREVGIVAATTNNPLAGCVVATWNGRDAGNVLAPLPATISLIRDAHFKLFGMVETQANLPLGADLINGMRRYIGETASFVSYNALADEWETFYPQNFNPYVSSSLDPGGCDRAIELIDDDNVIIVSDYSGSGLSDPTGILLVNDGKSPISQGTRLEIAVDLDGEDKTSEFVGKLVLIPKGYANLATGILDTDNLPDVGATFNYAGGKSVLRLYKPLLPGWGYLLDIRANLAFYEAQRLLLQGSILKFFARFAPFRSIYTPDGGLMGDYITAAQGKRRILPNGAGLLMLAAQGTGRVAQYTFEDLGEQDVPGLVNGVEGQNVIITNNGTCFVAETVPGTAALRAIAGSINGTGQPTPWSNPIAVDNTKILNIAITHPTIIRADYPDRIAGATAVLNGAKVVVYIDDNIQIRAYEFPIVGLSGETVLVGTIAPTATMPSLPIVAPNYGLFVPGAIAVSTADSVSLFEANEVRVAVAYKYENTVTSLSHDEALGCIEELSSSLGKISSLVDSWGSSLSIDNIRIIPRSEVVHRKTWRSDDKLIWYDSHSTALDDGIEIWKPNWCPPEEPGRFRSQGEGSYFRAPVLTIAAMRSLSISELIPYHVRLLVERKSLYYFDPNSSEVDTGDNIIRPTLGGAFIALGGAIAPSLNNVLLADDGSILLDDAGNILIGD
jgi:hypothetical protein